MDPELEIISVDFAVGSESERVCKVEVYFVREFHPRLRVSSLPARRGRSAGPGTTITVEIP